MIDPLHEAKMIRARKDRIHDHLYEANHHVREILWIHPNGAPVYLDLDQVQTFKDMKRSIDEILDRHEVAGESLKAAARRVA